jgi:hypothetical protein
MEIPHSSSLKPLPTCVNLFLSCHLHCEVLVFHRIWPCSNSLQLFPKWQHLMLLQAWIGHQTKMLCSILWWCDSLHELANKVPMKFFCFKDLIIPWSIGCRTSVVLTFPSHLHFWILHSCFHSCALHVFWINPSVHSKMWIDCLVLMLFLQLSVSALYLDLVYLMPISA